MEVQGYNNYLIYEDGRVFNKSTKKFKVASIFSQTGYKEVSLYKNNKRKHFLIHRLIAQYYIPNPDNKPQVDHKDRNRQNNHIFNLRWVSPYENIENQGIPKNNTSGHKGIAKHVGNLWEYQKCYRGKRYRKRFKYKTDALCYKFIILLKIKSTSSSASK